MTLSLLRSIGARQVRSTLPDTGLVPGLDFTRLPLAVRYITYIIMRGSGLKNERLPPAPVVTHTNSFAELRNGCSTKRCQKDTFEAGTCMKTKDRQTRYPIKNGH